MSDCVECDGLGGWSVYCCEDPQCANWERCGGCAGTGADSDTPELALAPPVSRIRGEKA